MFVTPGTRKQKKKESPDTLRNLARKKIAGQPGGSLDLNGRTPEELIEELRVHQIELEMQNEALRAAHLALEESRDNYLDLYEFAPVGYLTLTNKALIKEANLTIAALLGVGRRDLIKGRFRRFVAPEDIECWDRHFISVLHTAEKLSCELHLVKGDSSRFYARLESIRMERKSADPVIRIAISNINSQKQAEEEIHRLNEDRKILVDNVPAMIWYKDTRNNIIRVNPAAAGSFGAPANAIEGKSVYDLFPETAERYYQDDLEVIRSGIPKFGIIEPMKTTNGRNLWVRTEKIPLKDERGKITGILVFTVDITNLKLVEEELIKRSDRIGAANIELAAASEELRQNEARLTESLGEKEILLSEIHHRVKNNLTAFISLLSLEGSTEETPAGRSLKKDLQNRARSMALIHETLYRTGKFTNVDMQVYLTTLVGQIAGSYSGSEAVRTVINARGVILDIARATPAGLIINELVTNSFKYAFPKEFDCMATRKEPCTIRIMLTFEDGIYVLTVADNGIGLPPQLDPLVTKSLGLKLVNFLARHQLRAEINVRTGKGTEFIFQMNKSNTYA